MAHDTTVRRIALALTTSLWLAAAGPAAAADFWRCTEGRWTAIGQPRHPMPEHPCGTRLAVPREQAGCEAAGGRWGPAGLFPAPICRVPTRDGGRVCADSGECEGECLAAPTPAERDRLRSGRPIAATGTCTPHVPVFGCQARVVEGVVHGILCRD